MFDYKYAQMGFSYQAASASEAIRILPGELMKRRIMQVKPNINMLRVKHDNDFRNVSSVHKSAGGTL